MNSVGALQKAAADAAAAAEVNSAADLTEIVASAAARARLEAQRAGESEEVEQLLGSVLDAPTDALLRAGSGRAEEAAYALAPLGSVLDVEVAEATDTRRAADGRTSPRRGDPVVGGLGEHYVSAA